MTTRTDQSPHQPNVDPGLPLSQGHLKLLEICPRKFQHTYLDQLNTPIPPEEQDRLIWGSRFHLLMQQRELGLAIAPFATAHEPLDQWIMAFLQAESDILGSQPPYADPSEPNAIALRHSEHVQTLYWQSFLLTTIYDLLIIDAQGAQILDWKTYPRPQNRRWIAESWQTRLYLFVLAETSAYPPEHLSMTYWFFQSADQTPPDEAITVPEPQFWRCNYTQTNHEQTRRDLTRLLTQLQTWLRAYEHGEPFPQVPESSELCETCPYVHHCQRHTSTPVIDSPADLCNSVAEIPELIL
jgi:hypothetical protein